MYILPFGEFDVVGSSWVGCVCGWVFLGSDVVLDASFVTRDYFFIDFYLKVVLVIYPFCFSISALLFFVSVSCWDCVLYLL